MSGLYLPARQVYEGDVILVNAAHPLRGAAPPPLAAADPAQPEVLLHPKAALLLAACIRAAGGEGRIRQVSGWRSAAQQQAIWEDSLAAHGEAFTRSYVALPGCSEHQTGLAIDLGQKSAVIDLIRPAFGYDGACGAFRRLAARYGFVQRYEKGKEALTGIACEPWHFRYVGAPHALLMERHGLCLEEYAAFLQQGPRTVSLPGGRTAQVFYVPCPGGGVQLDLPRGCCQVSGDNDAGFIVTAWGCAV